MADPLEPDDPHELGAYRLLGRLGQGGMGTVYLGMDADQRLVAIKMVRADLAGRPEFRERFLREADMARRVARFCTAEVLAVVDPPDGPPYLVTEYIDGLTLTRAVRAGGPLRTAELERLAVSVAAALTAIHGAGLVHRDLKPSNVLLSALGPRVIDFGIAQATDADGVLSQDLQRIGTPAFMAPEQANGEPVTAAVDIFAWGGLVTYAGTGLLPFGDGPTPVQLYRVVNAEPLLDGLDPVLRPIVARAMSKDPAERPSAHELFQQLVRMGPATHPDPALSHVIRSAAIPAQPAQPAQSDGGAAPAPSPPAGQLAPPAAAGADEPAGRAGQAGWAVRPAEPAAWEAAAAELAAGLAAEPTALGRPGEAGADDFRPRGWADRVRHGSLMITPLLALLLIAVLIPVVLGREPAPSPTPAQLSAEVAATAERVRSADAGLADQLSLVAFDISPSQPARASLRTSFAGPAAAVLAGHTAAVLGVAVRPDGRLAATASADQSVRLWDISDRAAPRELAVLDARQGWVSAVAFSPDGTLLATAGHDRSTVLWDVRDPAHPVEVARLLGHEGQVLSVAFSPDGRLLATAGQDNTARLWDITYPALPVPAAVLARHTGWVRQVAFSPDGRLLATASTDRTARIWEISDRTTPRPLATITGHTDYVWALAFSPDGRLLATGGYDGTARLWDVTDPAQPAAMATLDADPRWVLAVGFSPDGRTLATGGWDTQVHLWDLTTIGRGAPPPPSAGLLTGHADWVQSLAFTSDGQRLLTGGQDRTARLTSLDDATLVAAACRDPANRLDEARWRHYIPGVPFREVC
ncbi:MAG: serine/threonine protein kinase [Frankia sp.]|nr:serine/threonine protein kinase [Frankia sp.]